MTIHTVKQGEFLTAIARKYGFSDWQAIWDHAQNKELKKKRQNPNILFPGDKLFVPEKTKKEVSAATEQRHRFQIKGKPLKLRLVLRGTDDKPLANTKCVLHVDGDQFELTSDGTGLVEHAISSSATVAHLVMHTPGSPIDVDIPIAIGQLDPVETVSGQIARLNNLGYFVGPPDDPENAPAFQSAVEEFQCDHKLTVDGNCGPKTQAKLQALHGC